MEYTLGQICLFSVVGICVVLASLGALALCIILISKIIRAATPVEAPAAAAPAAAAPAAPIAENATVGDLKLKDCDDKTAAMIMAIIADTTEIPLTNLRFKSITCLNPDVK